ncbi:hypothetical protein [Methylomonas koyamae]|uniref:hypothetical protein n=1 Tax=Methylomonas koyamae TaxID=702114 RepID=UPI00112834BE|nr:hypothetical protein [Methylomonas koyamae]TPQ26217.1 hypothetical protein C2U68_12310 [Methylomonas koyamae]
MKKQVHLAPDPAELRLSAERQLIANPRRQSTAASEEKRLMHELQVHQIELEMLNQIYATRKTNWKNPGHPISIYTIWRRLAISPLTIEM